MQTNTPPRCAVNSPCRLRPNDMKTVVFDTKPYDRASLEPATGNGGNPGNGGNGGAIVVDGHNKNVTLCGTRVTGNHANAFGGGVFRIGYAGESTVIDRSTFDDNQAGLLAGGLYLQGTINTVTGTTISRNKASGAGGVFFVNYGNGQTEARLTNVTIASNVALLIPEIRKGT